MFARKLALSMFKGMFSWEFHVIYFGLECYFVLPCNERYCDGCLDLKELYRLLSLVIVSQCE